MPDGNAIRHQKETNKRTEGRNNSFKKDSITEAAALFSFDPWEALRFITLAYQCGGTFLEAEFSHNEWLTQQTQRWFTSNTKKKKQVPRLLSELRFYGKLLAIKKKKIMLQLVK